MWTLLRALTYATFFVGVLLVVVPSQVLSISGIASPQHFGVPQDFGLVVVVISAVLGILCILSFVFIGKGSQAPFDAPRHLVIQGPYRIIRNPMYLGATGVLAGAALYYGSAALSIYAIVFWLITHLSVVFLEEPALIRAFGEEYVDYRSRVGRWLPRLGNSRSHLKSA